MWIVGRDVAGNRAFAAQLLNRLRTVPGLADARVQQPADLPRIFIDVDRTRAQQAGFSQRDIASDLLITLSGSQQTTPTFWLDPRNGVSKIIDDTKADLPKSSTIEVRGQVQTMNESFSGLFAGLVFAILLVYLLIVVNFQSWLDPFIIITALPGALAGIVWMLFLTHNG
ncbi:hypothetical protein AYM40_00545 [Paraburkholderia phytofirmans OLGA172]|uniref:Uncharacterized protein n=1 Tax=Paraburkholderia phytofirmans OLGA172 TaxID=1417228 RepID=A0A160FH15_9BURK|nr:hypothetical protein AYM40_00545 [Paraburkholderia phytofirmans OLGA172]